MASPIVPDLTDSPACLRAGDQFCESRHVKADVPVSSSAEIVVKMNGQRQ